MKFWKVILVSIVSLALIGGAFTTIKSAQLKASDSYIRDRVVMLVGNNALCSGIQVQAPSGKVFTLTAGHCSVLLNREMVMSINEQGERDYVEFVAIDPAHDLMLLTSVNKNSIKIAKKVFKHEHVHSITHGRGHVAFRTDGELLEEQTVAVHGAQITNEQDYNACPETSYQHVEMDDSGFYCALKFTLMFSTDWVDHGSSGGAVLNAAGELVGIVSVTDGEYSGFVPLIDIHAFLKHM